MDEVDEAMAHLRAGTPADQLETETLEFKQEARSVKETLNVLAEAVVCFANARGGTIVVGVADQPSGSGSFTGVSAALTPETVVRGIFDRTRPPLSAPVRVLEEGSARLVEVTVASGAVHYSTTAGTATRRVGAQCRPFTPEEQRQSLAARGLHDWSAGRSGARFQDLDPVEIGRVRRLLVVAGHDEVARLDDHALLTELRLLDDAGTVTRAALLLTGSEPAIERFAPAYGYSYQYRPSPGSETTARVRGRRTLVAAVDQLLDLVSSRRTLRPLNLAGGVQLTLQDYPDIAVRELVINALVHRDYEFRGAVEIEHTPERLTVQSPGGLVYGVTPDNILTHPSTPRNELLFESVTALQIAERLGQGVDRAYRQLLRTGKRPPTFDDEHTRVIVQVDGGVGDDAFARFVGSQLDDDSAGDLEVLLTLSALRERRSVDASVMSPLFQRSIGQAQATLERMAHDGLLEPTRRSARRTTPRYGLSAFALAGLGRAVTYHRRDPDGTDQKVIEHVSEYGFITNATLRRMLDINVYTARDLLRDLQVRQVLAKIGEQRSGPGVRYGPGAAFPGPTEVRS